MDYNQQIKTFVVKTGIRKNNFLHHYSALPCRLAHLLDCLWNNTWLFSNENYTERIAFSYACCE
jgi:acyl carrier protein phosphodiesterase